MSSSLRRPADERRHLLRGVHVRVERDVDAALGRAFAIAS
jgi:hypothetical protein